MVRCRWADPNSEIYLAYHDREWGRPEHDDRKLFEMLSPGRVPGGPLLAHHFEKTEGVSYRL